LIKRSLLAAEKKTLVEVLFDRYIVRRPTITSRQR